jgi:hypothetical protein
MKYVPVFRYRESEKKVLDDVSISNKILPLVEIIQEKRKGNMKTTCIDEVINLAKNGNTQYLVDFPLYVKIRSNTLPNVASFIGPLIANPKLRLNHFQKFAGSKNIFPVVSYNPNTPMYSKGDVANEITFLRQYFDQVALRVFPQHGQLALNDANGLLKEGDIILFDIDEDSHNNPAFTAFFGYLNTFAKNHGCKTVLIRAVIGPGVTNTGLTHRSVVTSLDNSLLNDYNKHGFDSFGDFCGIKKDELTKGGVPSPGCIFYHWWSNSYYGFKGTLMQPKTFTSVVVPALVASNERMDYQTKSASHSSTCPGCEKIADIASTRSGGNSAPKWKIIIASHYLHTMEEFL